MNELVPVTIIGGYLGAGKTTVINALLAGDHGRRLAVLVNDFGAINIDAELISSRDADTIGLQNGCICCSIADALGDALDRVLSFDPRPDQIVIEASGVADPTKIANYGQGWPGCRLDAVIVLAGADSIRTQAGDRFVGELVTRQLRGADLVLLTKTDLVDEATVDRVIDWTGSITARAVPVVPTVRGRVDPAVVLDLGPVGLGSPVDHGPTTADDERHRLGPETTSPGMLFESRLIELPGAVPHAALESVLDGWPREVVRVKGLVGLMGEDGRWLIQRVGTRWSIEPWDSTPPGPAPGRLVMIAPRGRADLAACERQLAEAMAAHLPAGGSPAAGPDEISS